MLTIRRKKAQATEPAAEADPGADGAPQPETTVDPGLQQHAKLEQRRRDLADIKARLHGELGARLDLARLDQEAPEHLALIREALLELVADDDILQDDRQRLRLVNEVIEETFGLGPLEALLADQTITDILVNGPRQIFVERDGVLQETSVTFRDDQHLIQIIDRIVAKIGRRIDAVSPMVDARLPDGSRVNAIVPPLAIDGPTMSIRRFGLQPVRVDDLLRYGSLAPEILEFLAAAVRARLNILIVGGTGSGKTTLLNCLSSYIPASDRILTIEDAAELQLQQSHVVRLETRPSDIDGRGQVTSRQLLKNALRMRPDRIIVGEVRGAEALDMLQAMNTGHEGSMTTLHANSTRDAINRIETMVSMAGFDLSLRAIRQHFTSAIQLVVQLRRLPGGRRRVMKVSEITGMEADTVTMQDLFVYEPAGLDGFGSGSGRFVCTGLRSKYTEHMNHYGVELSPGLFERRALSSE